MFIDDPFANDNLEQLEGMSFEDALEMLAMQSRPESGVPPLAPLGGDGLILGPDPASSPEAVSPPTDLGMPAEPSLAGLDAPQSPSGLPEPQMPQPGVASGPESEQLRQDMRDMLRNRDIQRRDQSMAYQEKQRV